MKSMPDPQCVFANTVLIAPRLPRCSKYCLWLLWTLWPTAEVILTLWCLTGRVRWVLLCTDMVFQWKLPEAVRPWWWELGAVPGFLSGLRCSRHTCCFMSLRGSRPSSGSSTAAFTLGLEEPGPFQHLGSLQASRTPRTQVFKSPQAVTQERDSVSREHAASSLPSLSLHLILETHSCSSPTPSTLETATRLDCQMRKKMRSWYQTVEEYDYGNIHNLVL